MNKDEIQAELRLFKSYTEEDLGNHIENVNEYALENGVVILSPISKNTLKEVIDMYGIKDEWQNTFHKSFNTVVNTPVEKLVAQQILHYMTTYGFEALGLYSQDLVYIPNELLEIPEFDGNIKLAVIKKISEIELTERIMNLITSGIALSKQSIADVIILSDFIDKERLDDITNRELKLALYDKYKIVPKNPDEFLKYVVFKLTGNTLVVKNKSLYRELKKSDDKLIETYLKAYIKKTGAYDRLSEIFLRNKLIFLAFKRPDNKAVNYIINRLKKASKKNHKPLEPNVLDRLTSVYKVDNDNMFYYNTVFNESKDSALVGLTSRSLTDKDLIKLLDGITIFREIRIINAIRYRLSANSKSILYLIRNGKTFVKDLPETLSKDKYNAQRTLLDILEKHFNKRVGLNNKTVYIPENVTYTAPTSEKQFIGNFPIGSSIELPRNKNIVIGVHWKNGEDRIDLDLHAYSRSGHFGWNSMYSLGSVVVFSGDVTDAPEPNGATECFLISNRLINTSFLMKLKRFTPNKYTIPFELIVASVDSKDLCKNYTIDVNQIITKLNLQIDYDSVSDTPDIDLAFVEVLRNIVKLSFVKYNTNKTIAGMDKDILEKVLSYSELFPKTQVTVNEILENSHCTICDTPVVEVEEDVEGVDNKGNVVITHNKRLVPVDFDLSPESISKDTIITLLS